MTSATARASLAVDVPPQTAFEIFTRDIDRWWRRGIKFRHAGARRGFIAIEPRPGGRLFESIDGPEPLVVEVGRITVWDPPTRLVFAWRNSNYAADESTEVEIEFTATARGTLVTVTHRGLTALPPGHAARHGLADGPFLRMLGLWWGDQLTSFRERVHAGH